MMKTLNEAYQVISELLNNSNYLSIIYTVDDVEKMHRLDGSFIKMVDDLMGGVK